MPKLLTPLRTILTFEESEAFLIFKCLFCIVKQNLNNGHCPAQPESVKKYLWEYLGEKLPTLAQLA